MSIAFTLFKRINLSNYCTQSKRQIWPSVLNTLQIVFGLFCLLLFCFVFKVQYLIEMSFSLLSLANFQILRKFPSTSHAVTASSSYLYSSSIVFCVKKNFYLIIAAAANEDL